MPIPAPSPQLLLSISVGLLTLGTSQTNGITQPVAFCVWLFSFSMKFSDDRFFGQTRRSPVTGCSFRHRRAPWPLPLFLTQSPVTARCPLSSHRPAICSSVASHHRPSLLFLPLLYQPTCCPCQPLTIADIRTWIRKRTSESGHLDWGLLSIGLLHSGRSLNFCEMRRSWLSRGHRED